MPVLMRYQSVQPNQTVTFDFGSDRVLSYVVGVSYWSFTFGSSDHHVQTVALGVTSNQPDPNIITAKVTGTLSDHSGHNIDNAGSLVRVCCVALVNSTDTNLALAGASNIPNGGSSGSIALPGSSLAISSAFLAGFNLSYGSTDHHVHEFSTAAGFTASGTQGAITGQASMSDESGNNASTATINGGLIAATPSETGLFAKSLTNLQTQNTTVVEFGTSISDAVVLLQDLDMEFDGDHHVKTLGGGTSDWKVSSTSVTLANARAFMLDNSGNNQVDAASSVSLVVVAIP
jgi:hypothetical protein